MSVLFSLVLLFVGFSASAVPTKRYLCTQNICVQQPPGSSQGSGLSVCRITCGAGSLWPIPTGSNQVGSTVTEITTQTIQFVPSNPPPVDALVAAAKDFFLQTLQSEVKYGRNNKKYKRENETDASTLVINAYISKPDTALDLNTDESYSLNVQAAGAQVTATIAAPTFFGMRAGLETLSQLIVYDDANDQLVIANSVHITDAPKYPYRGLLIDTSRNFYSIEWLKKTMDAMAFNKLNTFHWHMLDTASFPVESKTYPQMNYYGAYSPEKMYLKEDIEDFVAYATSRGVRIIPEVDAPAHAGNGWQWGPSAGMGDLVFCANQAPWRSYCVEPPCGQLNPINPNTQKVLAGLYQDFLAYFGNPSIFHMGGDEVNYGCWNSTPEIINYLKDHGMNRDKPSFLELWGGFQQNALNGLLAAAPGATKPLAVLWTSDFTNTPQFAQKYLPTDKYLIEVWDPSDADTIPNLLSTGYRIIVANYDAWYMDCGFGAWIGDGVNWCSPFKEWQRVYDNRPYKSLAGKWVITDPSQLALIEGGEIAMWSEQADDVSFSTKIWGRGAAIAERLWSDPSTDWDAANDRMQFHRWRLVARGVQAEGLQPLWCLQNQGGCP